MASSVTLLIRRLASNQGTNISPCGTRLVWEYGLGGQRWRPLSVLRDETQQLLRPGPVELAGHLVYAKPVLVDSPLPIGAAILAARTELTAADQRLLDGFLQHFDTRLDVAERLLSLRRETETLSFELRRATGQS